MKYVKDKGEDEHESNNSASQELFWITSTLMYPFFSQLAKPEPIMLLLLPIIPSRTSQNFYPLFLFYSHAITYVLFQYYSVVSVIMMSTMHLLSSTILH